MAKHTVKMEDFKGFFTEIELAGSYGKGANKALIAKIIFDRKEVTFKVTNQGEVICITQDLEQAIETYNELL